MECCVHPLTPVEGGFTIDLHGELGAILALVDGKQKLPDSKRAGSSLSVVAGARNQLYLPFTVHGLIARQEPMAQPGRSLKRA